MRTLFIVKGDPRSDAALGIATVDIALEVNILVFQRPPEPLDEDVVHPQRPRPSMEMATPAAARAPVKAAEVNCEPRSVLKISGLPNFASASSSAARQKETSIVFDSRHASTTLDAQSMIATR
jgi:hypothetical protein